MKGSSLILVLDIELPLLFLHWEREFQIFPFIFICKRTTPIVALTYPGDHDLNKLVSIILKTLLLIVSLCIPMCKLTQLPIQVVAPIATNTQGTWFKQNWIYATLGCVHTCFSFSCQIFVDFFPIYSYVKLKFKPTHPFYLKIMIWKNLNLHYLWCVHTSIIFL